MHKKDDPAFLYFPDNYRWSMGLLICLAGAPWMGAEIDEVNRVGRALLDRVGDDEAWFAEWKRMGDKVEARGRDALKAGHKRTAASCFQRASRYYQTGERFKQPRNQESQDTYAKSVAHFKEQTKKAGVEIVMQNHPLMDPVQPKLDQLAARKKGEANPYVVGPQNYQRFLDVIAACTEVNIARRKT